MDSEQAEAIHKEIARSKNYLAHLESRMTQAQLLSAQAKFDAKVMRARERSKRSNEPHSARER